MYGANPKFQGGGRAVISDVHIIAPLPGYSSTTPTHDGPSHMGSPEDMMQAGEHTDASSTKSGGMHLGESNGAKVRAHGDAEIDARIASLNKIIARLNEAQRLTSDEKTNLTTQLTNEIAQLTSLKGTITTDATTTLKGDVNSITKSFRVYALVMPRAAITAAADRIMTVAGQMDALSVKITARITAAQTAGTDVSAAQTAFADFTAKVADAKVQAQAAVSGTANLTPDNGDATIAASNTAALKAAKAKIDAAQADLTAARKDLGTIITAIRGKGEIKPQAGASVSASASVNAQ
jgi:uncharacterized small protein (DUF1192 family)